MCPSSRWHLSVFIQSGFHTVTGKEAVSISDQSHLQVYRWCVVHKQPRIWELSWPDVSCWTWDQEHHREHHFSFYLDLLQSIGRNGQLQTSIYDKRDDFSFDITNFPFLGSNIPSSPAYEVLSLNLYDTPGLAPRINVLFWGPGDFPVSELTPSDSWALTQIGTPCVFTILADRQGVQIALTQYCPCSNLL